MEILLAYLLLLDPCIFATIFLPVRERKSANITAFVLLAGL